MFVFYDSVRVFWCLYCGGNFHPQIFFILNQFYLPRLFVSDTGDIMLQFYSVFKTIAIVISKIKHRWTFWKFWCFLVSSQLRVSGEFLTASTKSFCSVVLHTFSVMYDIHKTIKSEPRSLVSSKKIWNSILHWKWLCSPRFLLPHSEPYQVLVFASCVSLYKKPVISARDRQQTQSHE